jgi:hypothetical protein
MPGWPGHSRLRSALNPLGADRAAEDTDPDGSVESAGGRAGGEGWLEDPEGAASGAASNLLCVPCSVFRVLCVPFCPSH